MDNLTEKDKELKRNKAKSEDLPTKMYQRKLTNGLFTTLNDILIKYIS